MPCFLFFLPQSELALLFHLFLRPANGFPLNFILLVLKLQRLLRLCADTPVIQLTADLPPHTLGIHFAFRDAFRRYGRAEAQPAPAAEEKIIHLVVLWLRAKGDFTDFVFAVVNTLI